jgi:hypothetical protein
VRIRWRPATRPRAFFRPADAAIRPAKVASRRPIAAGRHVAGAPGRRPTACDAPAFSRACRASGPSEAAIWPAKVANLPPRDHRRGVSTARRPTACEGLLPCHSSSARRIPPAASARRPQAFSGRRTRRPGPRRSPTPAPRSWSGAAWRARDAVGPRNWAPLRRAVELCRRTEPSMGGYAGRKQVPAPVKPSAWVIV